MLLFYEFLDLVLFQVDVIILVVTMQLVIKVIGVPVSQKVLDTQRITINVKEISLICKLSGCYFKQKILLSYTVIVLNALENTCGTAIFLVMFVYNIHYLILIKHLNTLVYVFLNNIFNI